MKLLYSPTSPFARKVRITLHEKQLECELVQDNVFSADAQTLLVNPLGKVPALVRDDGRALYDSPVIAQYLEVLRPEPRLWPAEPYARIEALRWEALGDGLCDAAVAVVLEGRRAAERQDAAWLARQRDKVQRALAVAQAELGASLHCVGDTFTIADIALICALGYLDLRMPAQWRGRYARLEAYAEHWASRPSVAATAPPPA